jgi:hypothetical protein
MPVEEVAGTTHSTEEVMVVLAEVVMEEYNNLTREHQEPLIPEAEAVEVVQVVHKVL